jgi:hypothetical protein
VVVARAARGLVGDIEPKPLQVGGINSVPDREEHPEFGCQTALGGDVSDRPQGLDPLVIASEETLLLGEEPPECLAVPPVRSAPTACHFEYSVVHSAEAELALYQRAGFIRDRVPRRHVLPELTSARAVERFEARAVGDD